MPRLIQLALAFLTPAPAAHRVSLRHVALSHAPLAYRLVRMRRRTVSISLEGGTLEARAPHRVPLGEIEDFIRAKERWILRRLEEQRRRPAPFGWQTGERLPLLGGEVTLQRIDEPALPRLDGARLLVPGDTAAARRGAGIGWLRERALALFRERLAAYASALGATPPALRLSDSRSEWGSCHRGPGRSARILLAWRLVLLPPRLIDYVIAHEAAHLAEHNHSARFQAVLERLYPGHREARRELNLRARQLPEL